MNPKVREKEKAIELRRQGYTYKDILAAIPVAKSSLSLWLKDLPLTDEERRYLRTRKDANISKGRVRAATANRRNRLKKDAELVKIAQEEFHRLKSEPLFLVGAALYWAEGDKRSYSCAFMNSDLEMIQVFMRWLEYFFGYQAVDLSYRLYIHNHYAHEQCEKYWSKHLHVPMEQIKISIKPDNKQIKKRPNYKGCLRVYVPKGGRLLFKFKVWHNMLAREYIK